MSIKLVPARTKQAVVALCVVGGLGLAACGSSAKHTSTVAQVPPPAATSNAAETLSTSSTSTTSGRPGGHHAAPKEKKGSGSEKTGSTSSTTTDPVSASTTTSVTTTAPSTTSAKKRAHRYVQPKASPIVSSPQSRSVLACLARSGVTHISQGSNTVWSGYDLKTGTFVFVYLYPTVQKATARARFLSPEEVAHAGRYLIDQPITRYAGSPVAGVTVCLGGKPPKSPAPKPGSFTF